MAKNIVPRTQRASIQEEINNQRGQLFQAEAIIRCVQYAVASQDRGLGDTDVSFALKAASTIIDDAAAALELVGRRP